MPAVPSAFRAVRRWLGRDGRPATSTKIAARDCTGPSAHSAELLCKPPMPRQTCAGFHTTGGNFMLSGISALAAATVLGLAAVSISATHSEARSVSSHLLCEAFGAGDTDL